MFSLRIFIDKMKPLPSPTLLPVGEGNWSTILSDAFHDFLLLITFLSVLKRVAVSDSLALYNFKWGSISKMQGIGPQGGRKVMHFELEVISPTPDMWMMAVTAH